MDEKKQIVVDKDACIGCGTCEGMCPEYFKLVDGIAAPTSKQYDEEDADLIEETVDSCPAAAISLKSVPAQNIELINNSNEDPVGHN